MRKIGFPTAVWSIRFNSIRSQEWYFCFRPPLTNSFLRGFPEIFPLISVGNERNVKFPIRISFFSDSSFELARHCCREIIIFFTNFFYIEKLLESAPISYIYTYLNFPRRKKQSLSFFRSNSIQYPPILLLRTSKTSFQLQLLVPISYLGNENNRMRLGKRRGQHPWFESGDCNSRLNRIGNGTGYPFALTDRKIYWDGAGRGGADTYKGGRRVRRGALSRAETMKDLDMSALQRTVAHNNSCAPTCSIDVRVSTR